MKVKFFIEILFLKIELNRCLSEAMKCDWGDGPIHQNRFRIIYNRQSLGFGSSPWADVSSESLNKFWKSDLMIFDSRNNRLKLQLTNHLQIMLEWFKILNTVCDLNRFAENGDELFWNRVRCHDDVGCLSG
jgi:hypothetical protein